MTNALATFSKKIDSQLVEPLKNVTIGRKLVPVTAPQGFGISSVDWGKITGLSGGYVSARAMFGGYGIYRAGVMFGLVEDGELYFKVQDEQKEKYLSFGGRPFTYMKEGKPQELGYYFIPEEVQENNQLFR